MIHSMPHQSPAVAKAPERAPLFTASNMAKWWARETNGSIEDRKCLLGAALFAVDGHEEYPVTAPPDPQTHILSVHLGGALDNVFSADERVEFAGQHRKGDVIVIPAGQRPKALLHKASLAEIMHLYIPDSLVTRSLEDMPGQGARVAIKVQLVRQDQETLHACKIVREEMRQPGIASSLLLDSIALSLAVKLIRRWSYLPKAGPPPASSGGLAPWQVRRVKEIFRDRLAEEIRLEELAAEVGLSTFHFARAFKQSTGVAPHRYQMQTRLETACELLSHREMSVLETAMMVGYESSQAFARAFRREYGCTPMEFRHRHASR